MCHLRLKVKMCPIFKDECDDGRLFSAVCIKCFVLLWTNRVLLSPVMKQATISSSSSERRQHNKAFSVLTWRCWDVQCWRREESVSEHTHTHPLPLMSHAECCRALLFSPPPCSRYGWGARRLPWQPLHRGNGGSRFRSERGFVGNWKQISTVQNSAAECTHTHTQVPGIRWWWIVM